MAITGHVTKQQAEQAVPVAGVEFNEAGNTAILYIDEGQGATELPLSLTDLSHLKEQIQVAINAMRWHNAKWMEVGFGGHMASTHLAAKNEEKTLCGRLIGDQGHCYPLLQEPSRQKRTSYTGGTCQRCLQAYDKQQDQPKAS